MGITEIPETPEKDQFDCHSPVAQASNLKLRNQRDSSNYSDDDSVLQGDVELKRKLFFDNNDEDQKLGGVGKDTPKDVCEDADETSDQGRTRSCASTKDISGVASLLSEDAESSAVAEEVTRKAEIFIYTEAGSACKEDLQEHIEKDVASLAGERSSDKEAEIMTGGAKCCHESEDIDAGSDKNNRCDYKLVTEMQHEVSNNVETIMESECSDKLGDETLEENSTSESKPTESKNLKSFHDECQGTLAVEENKSSDDIERISKCLEEIAAKPLRPRDVSDVSLEAKSPSGDLFPKSYAHRINALKSPASRSDSSKNTKQKPIGSLTQNLSLNVKKCKTPSPNKRSASLKQIASKKLLKKSTSLSRKKLFGNADNEFELDCNDDQFDTFSQRRKSKEDSVEEEVLNAKVIQSIITESLSTSAFKKKLKGGSKNSKRRPLKSILVDTKVNLEDKKETICDAKGSSSERRVSTRCNKGRMKTDPRFIFSSDKTLESADGVDPKTTDSEVAIKNRKKNVLTSINSDINENASKIRMKTKESNSIKSQVQDKDSANKDISKVFPEISCNIETQEKASNDFKTTSDSVIVPHGEVSPYKTKEKKVKRKSSARTLSDDLLQDIKKEEIEGDHKFDNKLKPAIADERGEIDIDHIKKEDAVNEKDTDKQKDLKLSGNKRTRDRSVKRKKGSLKVGGQVDEPKAKKINADITLGDASMAMNNTKQSLPMDISKHIPHDDDGNDFSKKNIGTKQFPKTRKSKSREMPTATVDAGIVDASRHALESTVTKPTGNEILFDITKKTKAKIECYSDQDKGREHQKRKHDDNDDEGNNKKRKCTDGKSGDDEKVMRMKSLRKSKVIESQKSEEGEGMDCKLSDFVLSRRSNRSQKGWKKVFTL